MMKTSLNREGMSQVKFLYILYNYLHTPSKFQQIFAVIFCSRGTKSIFSNDVEVVQDRCWPLKSTAIAKLVMIEETFFYNWNCVIFLMCFQNRALHTRQLNLSFSNLRTSISPSTIICNFDGSYDTSQTSFASGIYRYI